MRRRTPPATFALTSAVHPVLQRVYAARGLQNNTELDLSLERLLPVGSLDGVEAAAELLAAHRAGRVLVIGDFDADGATSTALVVRACAACILRTSIFWFPIVSALATDSPRKSSRRRRSEDPL